MATMMKVLIVEDEDFIRNGLIQTYDWKGHNCIVVGDAASGEEGLKLIQTLSPDLVITDIRMGGIDGLEMIRQGQETNTFYSILLTGYSEFEYAKRALSLRVTEYLLKPVDEEKLSVTIDMIQEERENKHLSDVGFPMQTTVDPDHLINNQEINYYVKSTLEIIKEEYNHKISIQKISEQLEVSDSYLRRKFKEETDITFVEFLNLYRIQKAILLLRKGGMRIHEISAMVGFEEYKRFSEVFKKYTGFSCSEFIATMGKTQNK